MNATRRRALVVSGLMLGTAALAHVATPRIHLADRIGKPNLEVLFPPQFGDWRIDTSMPIILPSPDVQAKLDAIYNQVLARTYVNRRGQRIMLSVAYGGDQSDGTRAHRPEVCYPVQGFQVIYNRVDQIPLDATSLPVRRLMARLGGRMEPISYWIVVGGEAVTSGGQQKIVELRYGLRGLIPDGMLVRISNIEPDMQRGFRLHDEFIADLRRAMDGNQQARVFGGRPIEA